MTIGFSINKSLHSNKPVWRERTRLTSSEVWAPATSKVWRDSGRASFSSHQALLAGWAAITLGPRGFFSRVARSFVRRSHFFSPRRMPRAAKQREGTLPDFPAFKTCFFPETGNRAWKPSVTQGMGYYTDRGILNNKKVRTSHSKYFIAATFSFTSKIFLIHFKIPKGFFGTNCRKVNHCSKKCSQVNMTTHRIYEYSGTPLIRPPTGQENLVVLTGWSY